MAAVYSAAVHAAPARDQAEAQKAIDARIAHFKDIGKTWEPIRLMLTRKQPYDAAIVARQAAPLIELSKKVPSLFEIDTHQFPDIKTDAREGIWSNQADFKAKAEAVTKEMTALYEAAKGGADASAFTKAAASVGKACGSCHDSYKTKKT
jgi:cytochrome c556